MVERRNEGIIKDRKGLCDGCDRFLLAITVSIILIDRTFGDFER